jgi:NAD(P)H dehydrogenase (quinone)
MRVLVTYYSRSGVTKRMAEIIAEELKKNNLKVDLCPVQEVQSESLIDYDGIIVGSPTYYGSLAYQVKQLFDESVSFHGKLDKKAGGVFTSSNNIGGGNETTLLSILEAMLIHGMVVQGDFQGDHYGPVSVGKVDQRAEKMCLRFAVRFAGLVKKISK